MNLKKHLDKIMEPSQYIKDRFDVSTSAEYFALPIEERETKKWYWPFGGWYLSPYAMAINGLFEDGLDSEWDKFYKQIKILYPVQGFLRNYHELEIYRKYRLICNIIREKVGYPVKDFFFRRNKDISKHIPNGYKHDSAIIEDVVFAVFMRDTSFSATTKMTEGDINEFTTAEWVKEHNDRVDMCDTVRKWINIDRVELKKKIEEEWTRIPKGKDLTYEQKYGTINSFEKELLDTDTKYLKWIIEQRESLN